MKVIKLDTEEQQLEAIRREGNAIRHIKDPSEKVQLEAVRQQGNALEHIENASEKVQLEAVRQDGNAIGYIENPSDKIIDALYCKGLLIAVYRHHAVTLLGNTLRVGCEERTLQEWVDTTESEIEEKYGEWEAVFLPAIREFCKRELRRVAC